MLDRPYCEDNEKTLKRMELTSPANFEIYVFTVSLPRLTSDDARQEGGIQEKTKNSESLQIL